MHWQLPVIISNQNDTYKRKKKLTNVLVHISPPLDTFSHCVSLGQESSSAILVYAHELKGWWGSYPGFKTCTITNYNFVDGRNISRSATFTAIA